MTRSRLKAFLRNFLPRQVRAHRILAGPLRGRKMVTSWYHNFSSLTGRTEPDVNSWFAKTAREGETWLDIGANYGYTALSLAGLVGPSGRVFAFEPKLATCGCLSETVRINGLSQVTVVPVALGTPKFLELTQFQTSGSMVVGFGTAIGPPETVLVAELDWLWPRISGDRRPIDGVKIDVQGMELDVLSGMKRLLRTYTPKLIVELHPGVDRNALLDLLESCGYQRQGIPVYDSADSLYRDNLSYAFTAPAKSMEAQTA
jgi:FkbM family methyltransferase